MSLMPTTFSAKALADWMEEVAADHRHRPANRTSVVRASAGAKRLIRRFASIQRGRPYQADLRLAVAFFAAFLLVAAFFADAFFALGFNMVPVHLGEPQRQAQIFFRRAV